MGWFDTVHDTLASLERQSPSEVASELKALMKGGDSNAFSPQWRQRFLGLTLWNVVTQSSFDDYVQETKPLQELVEEVSTKLLADYHKNSDIKTWMGDEDLRQLVKWSEGSLDTAINKSDFQPVQYRNWDFDEVKILMTGLLKESLHISMQMVNNKTGDKKDLSRTFDFNRLEISKLLGSRSVHFIGIGIEDVTGWQVGTPQDPKAQGKAGDHFMDIHIEIPFNLDFKGGKIEMNLHRTISILPAEGLVDHDGYWSPREVEKFL